MPQRLKLASQASPALISLSHFRTQRAIARKSVEYFEVCFGIEKRLLIALTVDVDEIRSQIAKQRLGGELVIDENLVASSRGQLATNDQLVGRTKTRVLE